MKLLAAALAGALIAGTGVYVWRSAELTSRQNLLLDAVAAQTKAEIETEQLRVELAEMRKLLRRLRSEAATDDGFEGPAPPLTTVEDGRHFGFIERVDLRSDPDVLVIDFAEFLSGEEANEAAREAGEIGPNETVPNDYFIRNVNSMLRTLEIASDAKVVVSTWDRHNIPDPRPISVERFNSAWSDERPWVNRITHSPYWIETESGSVVEIEEQYLP